MLTAVGNTAANRAFTFGVRGRPDRLRHQAQGLVVFGIGLAVTAGALVALEALAPDASRPGELVVLTAANVLATLIRFLLYRAWVFGDRLAVGARPAPHAAPAALSPEASR
jgi:putative flippase GtrA